MKQLTLIRHGAAKDPLGYKDFDRPLRKKGLKQAAAMGQQLKAQDFRFDQMFCSPALRALETAQIIYEATECSRPLLTDQDLYTFDTPPLYRFIEMIDDKIEHAVIVGHNPGLSYLAYDLLPNPVASMNTCTAIQMTLNINEWVEITSRCAQLLSINNPA